MGVGAVVTVAAEATITVAKMKTAAKHPSHKGVVRLLVLTREQLGVG